MLTLRRPPDLTIGPHENPQTLRWHLLRWRGIQVALHRWCRSDSDRALHDHSADNISILLWGTYREWFSHAWERPRWRLRVPLIPYFRRAETPHRVELHRGAPVWSIWIRFKPRREWGFWCRKGWRHWRDYVAERDYNVPGSQSTVGRGCD
jgi:hypothetical protein